MNRSAAFTFLWLALLLAILLRPHPVDSPTPGDDLIRNTIRLSLFYYAVAAIHLLCAFPADWRNFTDRIRFARITWTLAWLAYLIHLGMAFHYAHNWSHADAIEHTRDVSGFGEGIFVSHLFTLIWSADVISWWLAPRWYQTRSVWIDRVLHGFMAFMIFNGTVVFETGPIRWAGLAMFVLLAGVACTRVFSPQR